MTICKATFRFSALMPILLLMGITLFTSCDDDDDDEYGNWVKKSDFSGVARGKAVAFTIGEDGYVGTGYNNKYTLSDFWKFNPDKNTWTQVASLEGSARHSAVAFEAAGFGFVGLGVDSKTDYLQDFWKYDADSNSWSQVADFGGTARTGAVAFAIDDKGYVGNGYDDNAQNDFWQYDPSTDTWEAKASTMTKSRDAAAFTIDGLGYIVTGLNNGTYVSEFSVYNPEEDAWSQLNLISDETDDDFDDDYSGITGIHKVGFSMNGKGYLITGGTGSSRLVWEYEPSTDRWEELANFEGSTRYDAVGFVINNRGFVATGMAGSSSFYDDVWEFFPDEEENDYKYE